MTVLAAALAAIAAANALTANAIRLPYPPPSEMALSADDAVVSASLLSLGMRRLAADLAFVRLLIYYGTHEGPEGHEGRAHEDHEGRGGDARHAEHEETGWGHADFGGGKYPEIHSRIERIADMDPFWDYPILYGAGSLAFNLHRPEQAIALLEKGLRIQPRQTVFLSYLAAIGFQKDGDMARVVAELTPTLADPSAPTMLKNIVAFMNLRLGRKDEAIRLYREILESRDQDYVHVARRALDRLEN